MKQTVIETKGLSIGYPKTRKKDELVVLKDLNVSLFSGELTCLLGSNGVGKSTLLRTLTNMQPALLGDVVLEGKKINRYKDSELSTLMGLVLTDKTSVGGLTVKELVGLGRYPYTGFWGRLSEADNKIIDQAMQSVCIDHKADNYVSDLSDGERQKVMIAKALAQECKVIVLDEPTAFLDVINRFEIMSLLHRLATEQDKAILLSTHDMELAFLLADKLWLMSAEKGLKVGSTEDLILTDSINEYITNGRILFNSDLGRFVFKDQCLKEVYLMADTSLYHWAENFFERNGFRATSDISNALKVKFISASSIEVCYNDEKWRLSSFEELSNYLCDL